MYIVHIYKYSISIHARLFRNFRRHSWTTTPSCFIYCKTTWWSTFKESTIWRLTNNYFCFSCISFHIWYIVEINQQIIEDQSTQNVTTNSDNGTDNPLPRSRSSITRTLLMNTGMCKLFYIIILLESSCSHFKNETRIH